MLKKLRIILMIAVMSIATLIPASTMSTVTAASPAIGNSVWFSFYDWQAYLKGKNQQEFTAAFDTICKNVKANNCNSIIVHVRSHNDAAYYSSIYPFTTTMLNGDPGFDPLTIMPGVAHANGIAFHAWINPYGFRSNGYSITKALATDANIIGGVRELLAYGVDGIHFDDYFPPRAVQEHNALIKRVYDVCHEYGKIFGISPSGNYEANLQYGVDTWLSAPGYIDYIMPQLYWSNFYGADGKKNLYNEKLLQWCNANKAGIPMYTGLALYKAGDNVKGDPGWALTNQNLMSQWQIARNMGFKGFALFRYAYLLTPATQGELTNLRAAG